MTAKKTTTTATKNRAATKGAAMPAGGRDPEGGLTAKGRAFYNEQTGGNLKPGVRGAADTPEKMKRKGSFLTRHFTNPRGPMEKDGKPTRLALSAQAWGEKMPRTEAEAKKLAEKGRKLLERFHKATGTAASKKSAKKQASVKAAGKKAAASVSAAAKKVELGKLLPAGKTSGKRTLAKQSSAKKTSAKKTSAKKTTAKKTSAKKTPAAKKQAAVAIAKRGGA